jgi:hypothetical protein
VRENVMSFFQVWVVGLFNPSRAFAALRNKPAPQWGFWAVLIRFIATSLTTTLSSHLLGRVPFTPSRLTFLATDSYFGAEIFFLPLFGLAIWLLGSGVVHSTLRLTGTACEYDLVLNTVGMGMLIPMPVVWLWDWTMIALDSYRLTVMAVSHSLFALWGVVLYTLGFKRMLGLRVMPAFAFAIIITALYIAVAMIFIR